MKLLEPIAKANTPNSETIYARLMSDLLRAHVASNQVDKALADMASLEKSGAAGVGLTQLYFRLGKLLEKEIDRLRTKGDSAGLNKTQQAYQKFLDALARSSSGQTYESLEWAGESMLTLGNAKEAGALFEKVLQKYGQDQAFLATPDGPKAILRTKLKQSAALRDQGEFSAADTLIEQVIKQNPRTLEARIEKGLLLEARAEAKQGTWAASYNHWRTLALQLAASRPGPPSITTPGITRPTPSIVTASRPKPRRHSPAYSVSRPASEVRRSRRSTRRFSKRSSEMRRIRKPCEEFRLMSPRRTIAVGSLSLVMALALSVVPGTTLLADEIVLVTGSTVKSAIGGKVRGTIQSELPSEVMIKLGNTTTSVPTGEIVTIHYDGQPPSFALAEARESSGQLAEAADLYKKAAAETSGKPFVEQAAKFRQAELTAELALTDPARGPEAIALLDSAVKAYPNSRHVVAALDTLARLQLQKNDYAAVDRTIADMSKLPQSADRAAVLRAKVFDRKGDHAKAIAEYERLIKGSSEGSPRQREARLARAESLVGMKKFADAETDLRAVIQASPADDAEAQAAAYNTLGDCLRAAGKPKDALLAYLHTDLLYARDREQHPRALAQISKLWRQLKRDDRADEAWSRLKQDYPQSPWLSAARTDTP